MAGLAGPQDTAPALIVAGPGTALPGARTDTELGRVAAGLLAADPDGAQIGAAVRNALDMLLDGQHTGRYRWDQLCKTEKTHAGTLVEIGIQRRLALADGDVLDYSIAGIDVDCKFSHRMGRWMIPPEAAGRLVLLVQASDTDGTWSPACSGHAPATWGRRATAISSVPSASRAGPRSPGCSPDRRCRKMPWSG